MATHSSTLAWKIPWMEKPDRLQSMVSQRVGHDSYYSILQLPTSKMSVKTALCEVSVKIR